jgi:hypothetical protein
MGAFQRARSALIAGFSVYGSISRARSVLIAGFSVYGSISRARSALIAGFSVYRSISRARSAGGKKWQVSREETWRKEVWSGKARSAVDAFEIVALPPNKFNRVRFQERLEPILPSLPRAKVPSNRTFFLFGNTSINWNPNVLTNKSILWFSIHRENDVIYLLIS